MKILKIVLFFYIIGAVFSCGENSRTKDANIAGIGQNANIKDGSSDDNDGKLAVNLEKISLKIDGMTCEIGCARTIQSKLSKANGVKNANVSFEEKTGVVEFDANKITENQIVEIVEGIAGGDLYEVKEVLRPE